jgi:exonuclease VII small subunit
VLLSFPIYAILRERLGKEEKMPELFKKEYEEAKAQWEHTRETLDKAINLYEAAYDLLKQSHEDFELAAKAFHQQQALIPKTGRNLRSVKSIKKGE